MYLEKLIIAQDDCQFTQEQIEQVDRLIERDKLILGLHKGFGFSFFGIHKKTWRKVGRFDENFKFVYGEDNDYQIRCELKDIEMIYTKTINPGVNKSVSIKTEQFRKEIEKARSENMKYIRRKWNQHCEGGLFKTPFDSGSNYTIPLESNIIEEYRHSFKYQSELEFKRLLKEKK